MKPLLPIVPVLALCAAALHGGTAEFVFEPLASHPKCHAATVVELNDGAILAAWFAGEKEGSKDQAIFASRKPKNGAWTAPRILFDTPDVADFNPVLLNDGKMLHLFVVRAQTGTDPHGTLWHLTSKDSGSTWSEPARVTDGDGFWGRNAPFRLGGQWIIPASDVQRKGARFLLSKDLRSFRFSSLISADRYLTQPAGAPLGGREVAAVLRERSRPGGHVWFALSSDAGETWAPPRRLDFPNPDSGIALQSLPGGRLLLVYNHTDTGRTPLNTAVSADKGKTWRDGPVLETQPGEYSYPTTLLGSDGLVHIFYTWKRTHVRHVVMSPSELGAFPK
jgi:predicted neuraminidase